MKNVNDNITINYEASWKLKFSDYAQLIKFRLSSLVVFSSVITYLTASQGKVNWFEVFILGFAGLLVTGAANGINQIIEKDYDKLMTRTANRPVSTGRMSVMEAGISSTIMGLIGVLLIGIFLNKLSGALALVSLLSYAFVYTPLKRITPVSVFVGAFPGAFPTMLGWVAYTNRIDLAAIILFTVQFVWQFPHFWSIAWLLEDDYKKAGFKMLPFNPGRTKKTAFQCLLFSLLLVPIGILPTVFGISGIVAAVVAVFGALYFSYYAYKLYKSCELADAKKLMLAAIVYLPIVQLFYLIDKI
ncbi:MAG: heme o synthase [Bacteroidota bacterium]